MFGSSTVPKMTFKKPVILLFSAFQFLILVSSLFLNQEQDQDDHQQYLLAKVVYEIVDKVFVSKHNILNIIDATNEGKTASAFVNNILLSGKVEFSVNLESPKKAPTIKKRKKRNNVIILEKINDFYVFVRNLSPEIFEYRGYFVFVLIKGKFEEIEEIFAGLWKKNIYNVAVIYQQENIFEIATFLAFDGNVCDNTKPKVINRYQNGSFAKSIESIFPSKFENLQNCPLIVSTHEETSAVIITRRKGQPDELTGFDLEIMRDISKALNFKPVYEVYVGEHAWGDVLENGTAYGAFGKLWTGKAHIAMARFYLKPDRLAYADPSIVYLTTPEVMSISPGRKMSGIEKLLQPFETPVWILFSVVVAVALLVIAVLNLRFQQHKSFVYGVGVEFPVNNLFIAIVGGSQTKLPRLNFARFLLMMFLIFCLVMRSAYQGALYNFLQSDRHAKAVETIDDLVEQEYDLYMVDPTIFATFPKIMARQVVRMMFYKSLHFILPGRNSSREISIKSSFTHL